MPGVVVAQALVERGLIESIIAGVGTLSYRLDGYVGQGNSKYVFVAVGVAILVFLFRGRR